ncbi:PleD family two-component system response regulator [Synechococcus sp. PCC 7336]|uniref:response regulator n=1 Tax=Synechococcus sp. PCC 7336 TaxID=195250 RepID=UPI00034907B9|nr:response regulator [Synechococcus sp. PCC 7336]
MTQQILVIDDDSVIRLCLRKILLSRGYSVICAASGKEGLELARRLNPDLIICDIMMPGLNGYALLSELRQDSATKDMPFLFLSAKSKNDRLRMGINLGADNYLTKPFSREEVIAAVEARLTSLDRHNIDPENVPHFLGNLSSQWICENLISPSLKRDYPGWFVALEPNSGKCFLGKTKELAYRAGHRVFPDKVFFFRELPAA